MAAQGPAATRLAATVLLLRDDPLRVLMVERPSRGTFPSVMVFPGGSVDAADGDPDDGTDIAIRAAALRETAEETGIGLDDPAALVPLAHWVTPPSEPRRFDTYFFVARAPEPAEARVDGIELVSAEWIEPVQALRRHEARAWRMLPPTALNLHRVAEQETVEAVLAAARLRPHFTVRPDVVADPDGARRIRIPVEAGYTVSEWVLP